MMKPETIINREMRKLFEREKARVEEAGYVLWCIRQDVWMWDGIPPKYCANIGRKNNLPGCTSSGSCATVRQAVGVALKDARNKWEGENQ